jgi:hypothetical protein
MQLNLTFRRPVTAVVVTLVASASIAACGGSSASHGGSGSSHSSSASAANSGVKFASCVRAHGVPDYPDARAGKTVDIHSLQEPTQAVETAIQKCQSSAPAQNFGPILSTTQLAKVRGGALAMARCMRAHGLVYPDPVVAPGPGGHGFEYGFSRAELKSHPIDYTSPAYKAANTTCSKLFENTFPASLRKAA